MLYQNKESQIYPFTELDKQNGFIPKEMIKLTETQLKAYNNKPEFGTWNGNGWDIDEVAERQRLYESWKAERQSKVDNIEVELNGVIYQGDETSQTRIARAVSVMEDTDTTMWVAKDNSVNELSKADLKYILKEAGIKQTLIWNDGRPEGGN